MGRLIIYTGDVQELTGLSKTTAKLRLAKVREHYGIPKWAPVTVAEFCEVNRLDLKLALDQLDNYKKRGG